METRFCCLDGVATDQWGGTLARRQFGQPSLVEGILLENADEWQGGRRSFRLEVRARVIEAKPLLAAEPVPLQLAHVHSGLRSGLAAVVGASTTLLFRLRCRIRGLPIGIHR